MLLLGILIALVACSGGGGGAGETGSGSNGSGGSSGGASGGSSSTVTRGLRGVLFFASYTSRVDESVLSNPTVAGALYTVYWSDIESAPGRFDWSAIDASIDLWRTAGKGVALRVMWSSSGYWPDPRARRPTPAWVLQAGAGHAYHAPSDTEIPLFWDPIYQQHAQAFLAALAARYDRHPDVLFIDATPGAETNPYRLGTIDDLDPSFREVFLSARASDGSTYGDALWWSALQTYIGRLRSHFPTLPVLVTLNTGALPGDGSRLQSVGDLAVSQGLWVGQNGLKGSSYAGNQGERWRRWGESTRVFFEMSEATGPDVGTMQEVVDACLRVQCDWLNVYHADVRAGTPGSDTYEPAHEDALLQAAAEIGR